MCTQLQTLICLCLLLFMDFGLQAQTSFCPGDPPRNAFLADSPWPIYHRNNFAQASTCIAGPLPGDSLVIKSKLDIQGSTSPWVYLSDRYPSGERVLLYSNATHAFKFIDTGTEIVTADSIRIDFDPLSSFSWSFLLSRNKVWFTYDPKYDPQNNRYTRLFKLTDADTTDPWSDIVVLDTFNFNDISVNRVQHYSINYDGHIVFNSDNDSTHATVGIIDQNFNVLDTLRYPTTPDEIVHHNAFPIDTDNSFYIVTTKRLIKFAWDGNDLTIDWEAPYDFVFDGPTGSFAEGSGTTPTFMGWGPGNDKLVVMADGHSRNNLVAFWRELPPGWTGINGMDIHFADSIQIPLAIASNNTFQSIENSPTVFGYDVGIAQFNGFLSYPCINTKGVQKISWDTATDQFSVAWANDTINMNGVLTYSAGTDLVYCSGKEADCNYYYYGLDWNTGAIKLRFLLGPEGTFFDDPFYDAGNNNIIDEDGSIYFPGGASLIKVEIAQRAVGLDLPEPAPKPLKIWPQPAGDAFYLDLPPESKGTLQLFDLSGRVVMNWSRSGNEVNIEALPPGLYGLQWTDEAGIQTGKILKQ